MLTVHTSNVPDVRPAIPAIPEITFPHPSIFNLQIERMDINAHPTVLVRLCNFRLLVDEENNPILLADSTQKAEYCSNIRSRSIEDLYAWIAGRPNAMDLVAALDTLLSAIIDYDQELVEQAASSSSSAG